MTSFDELFARARRVRLHPAEKAAFRGRLLAVMERSSHDREKKETLLPSPYARIIHPRTFVRAVVAALVVLVALGGGVTSASARALPGDELYPLKLRVERLASAVRITPEAKALYTVSRIDRRLFEASDLINNGTTDAEIWHDIEENLNEHFEILDEQLEEIAERDIALEADVASDLESILGSHGATLREALAIASTTPIAEIIAIVAFEEDAAAFERRALYEMLVRSPDGILEKKAQEERDAAVAVLTEAREKSESNLKEDSVNKDVFETAVAQAEQFIAEGQILLEEERFAEAFVLFDSAEYIAQGVIKGVVQKKPDVLPETPIDDGSGETDDQDKFLPPQLEPDGEEEAEEFEATTSPESL